MLLKRSQSVLYLSSSHSNNNSSNSGNINNSSNNNSNSSNSSSSSSSSFNFSRYKKQKNYSSNEISSADSSNSCNNNSNDIVNDDDDDNHNNFKKKIDELKRQQELSLCNSNGNTSNKDLSSSMRVVLIDWLTEITELYKLHTNTIHLAVFFIDEITRKLYINMTQYQLLGTACLVVACKFDDSKTPSFSSLVSLANYEFYTEDLVMMEELIIRELDFKLHVPTRDYFSTRLGVVAKLNEKEMALLEFITELSLRDPSLNSYRMSQVSASVLHYVFQCLRPKHIALWTKRIEMYTTFTEHDLIPIVLRLVKLHSALDNDKVSKNILSKYQTTKYHYVGYQTAIKVTSLRFGIKVNIDSYCESHHNKSTNIDQLPLNIENDSSSTNFFRETIMRSSFESQGYYP